MNSINISILSQMNNPNIFSEYESTLSGRLEKHLTKDYEQASLKALVQQINLPLHMYDGFFFSYKIEHIGKEFDLLKITKDKSRILNIELKSQPIELDEIEKQLRQNLHYLGVVSKNIYLFTYIASTNTLYFLDEAKSLKEGNLLELRNIIISFACPFIENNIESLFIAKDFLISPMNTPEKFLAGNYFLTNHQEKIKKEIISNNALANNIPFTSITGGPGTGKTLLLYDLAKNLSNIGKVCIIHCGILCEGHTFLNSQLTNIHIKAIKEISIQTDFSEFAFLLIDEAQRIYANQFELIISTVSTQNKICIFSYDSQQVLTSSEEQRNIVAKIEQLSYKTYKLSDKIRTNKELSSFIRSLLDLNKKTTLYDYKCVDVLYAPTPFKAQEIINLYKKKGYTFINFTSSNFRSTSFDIYGDDLNTHKVIGQEFDNVIMVLNGNFYYDSDGKLNAMIHPNPDYLYRKLLFQGVSRTRTRLCLVIVSDLDLFQAINSIKIR